MNKLLKDKQLGIYPFILESVVTTINVQDNPFYCLHFTANVAMTWITISRLTK